MSDPPAPGPARADGLGLIAVLAGLVTVGLALITLFNGLDLAPNGLVDPSKIGVVIATGTGTFVAGLVWATCTIVYFILTTVPAGPAPDSRAVEP